MAFVRLLLSSHFFTGDWRHMTVVHSVDLQHPYLKENFPKLHNSKMPTNVFIFGYVCMFLAWTLVF